MVEDSEGWKNESVEDCVGGPCKDKIKLDSGQLARAQNLYHYF